ncbi:PepSY domain-containing protein [Pseudomonas alkylphenolica]|uniref:PepSY domain-containing protein n=1 Tax=Pseudomonas alkylphenolica TaxID=237609 RepID=A0A443ZQW7_9PSED|nr:PepSY-associated TM helix domain-containing protein [Pseudomonas alkylphenolica]RWU21494.1 PepSY domain-containing protein [Pseudomonas alkylphenolica]
MKKTFTQSMAWLHTWAGLIVGWLLFAIFATGTLAVFDKEIDHWMRPEIPRVQLTPFEATQRALGYLQSHHADASSWNISLPTERNPGMQVSAGERRRGGGVQLDPATGEPIAVRDSVGGTFFFRFHFTLNLPRLWGIFTVGALGLMMLVALVSGVVIHKKIFKEFFTFRPNKGQRSWLDFHNASAVLLLPFHLMITYTGLVIFMLIYVPAAVDTLFAGNNQAYFKAQQGGARIEQPRNALKQPAVLTDLQPLLIQAEQRLGSLGGLSIQHPGTAAARVEIRPELGNRIALSKGQAMVFDGVSGALLRDVPEMPASVLTQRVMVGLHFAQFGGYPMRWLYFICALVSSAMIASGLVLFCVKRQRKYAGMSSSAARWYRLAEVLNVAFVAGLLLACVGLFWANRLLPAELAQRGGWELRAFFGVWLLSALHAALRPARRAWSEQLGATALLCMALPLLGPLTAVLPLDASRQALETTSLMLGLALAFAAWRSSRPQVQARAEKSRAAVLESE